MLFQQYHTIIIICITITKASCYTVKDVNTLKAKLMEGYNKHTHPLAGKTLNVTVAVLINSISDLDEQMEKLSADVSLLTKWQDPSMKWNKTETKIESIEMHPSEVWIPEISVHNRHHDQSIRSLVNQGVMPVDYYSDGNAFYSQDLATETACDLDTSKFPFDRHTCVIEFHVTHRYVSVIPKFKDYILNTYKPDGSWQILNATIGEMDHVFWIFLQFERKPTFILLNLILPIVLLALLSPLVFLLPNQSGEKVAFAVTVLLTTSVYMTIISDYVPQKSDPIPLISTMLFTSYSLTCLVIIIVIINARIYRIPNHTPIPRCLSCLLSVTTCLCYCFRRRNKAIVMVPGDDTESLTNTNNPPKQNKKLKKDSWKDVGWAIDMFFMILIYALKIILFLVFLIVLKSTD